MEGGRSGRCVAVVVVVAVATLCLSVVVDAPPSEAPASLDSEASLLKMAPSSSDALPCRPLRRSAWAAPGTSTSTVAMARPSLSLSQMWQDTEPSFISAAEGGLKYSVGPVWVAGFCLAGVLFEMLRVGCRVQGAAVDARAGPIDLSIGHDVGSHRQSKVYQCQVQELPPLSSRAASRAAGCQARSSGCAKRCQRAVASISWRAIHPSFFTFTHAACRHVDYRFHQVKAQMQHSAAMNAHVDSQNKYLTPRQHGQGPDPRGTSTRPFPSSPSPSTRWPVQGTGPPTQTGSRRAQK